VTDVEKKVEGKGRRGHSQVVRRLLVMLTGRGMMMMMMELVQERKDA